MVLLRLCSSHSLVNFYLLLQQGLMKRLQAIYSLFLSMKLEIV